jgi:hypothetical protein
MGSGETQDDFYEFADAISRASIICLGLTVRYESPALGSIQFGWSEPFIVNGREIPLAEYPRFDNAYCQAEIGDRTYTIQRDGALLTWELEPLQTDKT